MSVYTIGEILIFLITAALVGALIGWLLRSLRWGMDLGQVEATWRTRYEESQQQVAEASTRLQDEAARRLTAEEAHHGCDARIASLEAELRTRFSDVEQLRQALESAERATAAAERHLSDRRKEAAETEARVAALQARLAEVEPLVIDLRDREAQIVDPVDRPAEPALVGAPSARAFSAEEAQQRVPAIAERTAGGALVEDDLELIRGIGPKLAGRLKGLRITSFRQVAGFSDEDIATVAAALGIFTDRIRRDDWLAQARRLHLASYGEDPS